MLEKAKTISLLTVIGTALFASALLFSAPRAFADSCEGGVWKGADGATKGTCTLSSGTSLNDISCNDAGKLVDGSGGEAGTCAPSVTASGGLSRDGIFGCTGSKYANVGSTVAIGGVYVPVNDAAVTLNTGYLVYKECVLDGTIAKITEAARSDLTATVLRNLNQGRDGQPRWVRNVYKEIVEVPNDKVVKLAINEATTNAMCPVFRNDIRRNYLVTYLREKNAPSSAFACSFPSALGDQQATLEGDVSEDNVLDVIGALSLPENNPYMANLLYKEFVDGARAAAQHFEEEKWKINNGFLDVTDGNENPFEEKTLTPGYLVSQGAEQVFTSGFRCLEGADELSEVCAPLFSSLVPESFTSGLFNMTRRQSGLSSYVGRMVSEARKGVQNEARNTAVRVLDPTRTFEVAFLDLKKRSRNLILQTINRLRTMERNCWEIVISNPEGPHVCSAPPDEKKMCNASGVSPALELKVATSTQFSKKVIDSQIKLIQDRIEGEIEKSEDSKRILDLLIADVTGNSSGTVQGSALSRLDALVAQNARYSDCDPRKTLHTAGDVECSRQEFNELKTALEQLLKETADDWGNSTNVNVGWCNVNNPPLIQKWIDEWK
jgi:hypothetical protein